VVLYLKKQIEELKQTSIEPDLSKINSFYREKTEENVNRINTRLKVPNLVLWVWSSCFIMFIGSGLLIFNSMKSKQTIIDDYHNSILKENVIISKENNRLLSDMTKWFNQNPKGKEYFVKWRSNQKTE